jgi:CheY-like chemotaxis protein/anti-sigma regulatory factor (Ser/Thr protein kinase)
VVDDEAPVRALLCRALVRAGFEAAEAADAAGALERHRSLAPLVTVLDLVLPGATGLSLLAEIRKRDSGEAIIVITGSDEEEAALRAGASSFFRKPFVLPDLVQEVRRLAAWRMQSAQPGQPAPRPVDSVAGIGDAVRRFSLATRQARDPSVIAEITLPLGGLLDEAGLLGVRIGIGEMITNAFEHGNLGISAAEKEQALAENRFAALLAERLADPRNAERRVWIESRLEGGEFRVMVRDEGAGFDWRSIVASAPGASLAGRGVLLTRVHFDEVRWNESGNEVTLVRRIPEAP